VKGGGVEKPPATALPVVHFAVATGPICETAGVGTVELTALALGTPRWQLTYAARLTTPEKL
jgi:hypothetical protein